MTREQPASTELSRSERCHKLAHDMKNSLSVIGTGLEVLKLSVPEEKAAEVHEICAMMDRERRVATDLVADFLEAALREEA